MRNDLQGQQHLFKDELIIKPHDYQSETVDLVLKALLSTGVALVSLATGLGSAGTSSTTSPDNGGTFFVDATNGPTTYAADTVTSGDNFTDLALREAIKLMDDADVPMDNRCLVIPPAARKSIMGIDRYVSSDFVGGRGVESGLIGNLYGVDVYVSSNAPILETAAQNGAVQVRGCLFFHKDAIVLAEQMAVRSQTQYKQEYLSTLYTADTLYGIQTYRPEAGFVIAIADE